jgi:type II protein arginine methyltransferase
MITSSAAILGAIAEERFADALQGAMVRIGTDPHDQFAHQVVARLRQMAGDDAGACALLRPLAERADAQAPLLSEYGSACIRLGDVNEAIDAFRRAVALAPAEAAHLQNLAAVLQRAERWEEAVLALRTLLPLDPANRDVILIALRDAQSRIVPVWHFAMMNDELRNARYATAIEAFAPGRHVLEIGTGAGLLAMIAARAGAASVVTCEQVPLVADTAAEIIAANGFADAIRVIAKSSLALDPATDLERKPDVLVTEIFSCDLLAEQVLPAMRHARAVLLAPGATIVPAAASAVGRLTGGHALRDKVFAGSALGFDVSSFGRFAPRRLGLDLAQQPHIAMSDARELLRFDFNKDLEAPAARELAFVATEDGICVGVAQWIRLDLSPGNVYENDPSMIESCWQQVLHCMPAPVALRRGDVVRARVTHDDRALTIEFPSAEAGP